MTIYRSFPLQQAIGVKFFSSRYWIWMPSAFGLPENLVGRSFVTPAGTITYPADTVATPTTKKAARKLIDEHLVFGLLDHLPDGRDSWRAGFSLGRYFAENPQIDFATAQLFDESDLVFSFSIIRPLSKTKLEAQSAFDALEGLSST